MVKLKAETCSENCPSIGLKRLGATVTTRDFMTRDFITRPMALARPAMRIRLNSLQFWIRQGGDSKD